MCNDSIKKPCTSAPQSHIPGTASELTQIHSVVGSSTEPRDQSERKGRTRPERKRIPNFEGFPTTLFIDRTGKVRLKVVGYHSLVNLEGVVATLLAESPGRAAN